MINKLNKLKIKIRNIEEVTMYNLTIIQSLYETVSEVEYLIEEGLEDDAEYLLELLEEDIQDIINCF